MFVVENVKREEISLQLKNICRLQIYVRPSIDGHKSKLNQSKKSALPYIYVYNVYNIMIIKLITLHT